MHITPARRQRLINEWRNWNDNQGTPLDIEEIDGAALFLSWLATETHVAILAPDEIGELIGGASLDARIGPLVPAYLVTVQQREYRGYDSDPSDMTFTVALRVREELPLSEVTKLVEEYLNTSERGVFLVGLERVRDVQLLGVPEELRP